MKALLLILAPVVSVSAHSGGTDAQGGHHDRKHGGYHFHHGMPAHQHPDGICPYADGGSPKRGKSTSGNGSFLAGLAGVASIGTVVYFMNKKK
jgi:hypothetical protein